MINYVILFHQDYQNYERKKQYFNETSKIFPRKLHQIMFPLKYMLTLEMVNHTKTFGQSSERIYIANTKPSVSVVSTLIPVVFCIRNGMLFTKNFVLAFAKNYAGRIERNSTRKKGVKWNIQIYFNIIHAGFISLPRNGMLNFRLNKKYINART